MNRLIVGLILVLIIGVASSVANAEPTRLKDANIGGYTQAQVDTICVSGYVFVVVRTNAGVDIEQVYDSPYGSKRNPIHAIECGRKK